LRTSITPVLENLTITGKFASELAPLAEKPTTPFIAAWLGVAL
jgi:hypothetical protein